MTADNRPLSEIYASIGAEWAEAEALASIKENTETADRSRMILDLRAANSNLAFNQAEAQVKASKEWDVRVHETVEARKQANLLRVRLESIKMEYGEWNSAAANERLVHKF